jgi:hypothetical protein
MASCYMYGSTWLKELFPFQFKVPICDLLSFNIGVKQLVVY